MKVTLNWLREFVALEIEVSRLCDRLAMGGLEVEGVEELGADLAGVVVGEIVSTRAHPAAERLTICEVRSGGEAAIPVVCGATNMKAGDRVAFAAPGVVLPGGKRIEAAEIRGVTSGGMLCSEAELGVSEDHAGILILGADAPLGERVAAQIGLEDTVIELSVTPNRGDCLSVLGVAREIAALTGARLLRRRTPLREGKVAAAESVRVRIEDPAGCARYAARLVRGTAVRPSPLWMQLRLRAVGLRPINNVVDVTNYVMIERGQPLHAFDFDRLPEPQIVVRRAGASRRMRTLDGDERELASDDLLITTGAEPIAIAGVMGGADTEVTAATKNVLLESAWFDPASVRRTRRRLDLPSEASFRFERHVDVAGVPLALDRAAGLVKQLAGGEVAAGIVEDDPGRPPRVAIALRPRRVQEILGSAPPRAEIAALLKGLGASVSAGAHGVLEIVPPTFRSDLAREIDLIEEVARVAGYDRFPATMPVVPLEEGTMPPRMAVVRELKRLLAALGLFEVVPYSFSSPALNEIAPGVNVSGSPLRLLNPLTREDAELRRSLLGGLLSAARHNRHQGVRDVAIFTVGRVFWRDGGAREGWRLGGLLAGNLPRSGLGAASSASFADAKGVAESVLERLDVLEKTAWSPAENRPPFHPGKSASIVIDGEVVGVLGALHPEAEAALDVDWNPWLFELDLEKLLSYRPARRVFAGLPRYPSVARDLAIVVDADFPSDRIVQFVRQWRRELVEEVKLFDQYAGPPIPEGKKSLAYAIAYRAADRTLTDDEVNALQAELIESLRRSLSVELR
jgi:phenylalanyl-tRNA synthetase beta chain